MGEGYVYFLQMKMGFSMLGGHKVIAHENGLSAPATIDLEGPIKIGFSTDVRGRCCTFDEHSPFPVKCLGVIPGDMLMEKSLHEKFSEYRIRANREWFYPHKELREFIIKANRKATKVHKKLCKEIAGDK